MKYIKLDKADLYCVIYDNKVTFELSGILIGYLTDFGNIDWYGESKDVKNSIKKECRNFINNIIDRKIIIT